jgi:hypothetical protein
MFNEGTIAQPNLNGWSLRATTVTNGNVLITNKKRTATLDTGKPESTVYAVKGVTSGSMDWWITLETGVFDSYIGVVGTAARTVGLGSTNPFVFWWRLSSGSPEALRYQQGWSGGTASGGSGLTPGFTIPQTLKLTMNANTKRASITDGVNTHFRDFDTPDLGPWYPVANLLTPGASVTISYTDPTL